jgi:hypothetical protein
MDDPTARAFLALFGDHLSDGLTPPADCRAVKACGAECGKDERTVTLLACTGCNKMLYCSSACQRKDWTRHKPECRDAVEALAREGVTYVQRTPTRAQRTAAASRAAAEAAREGCCLCGGGMGAFGNNPAPFGNAGERCCDTCNATRVVPARLAQMFGPR